MGSIAVGTLSLGAALLLYKYVDLILTVLVMAVLRCERAAIRARIEIMLDKDPLILRAILSLRGMMPLPSERNSTSEQPVGDRGG